MVPDYGKVQVGNDQEKAQSDKQSLRTPETEQFHVFFPSVSVLVKSPYVFFSISTSRSPVMLRFKILKFLSL